MAYPQNSDEPIAGDQLKSIVERIERLEEERKTVGDDISDVYKAAKSNGFDTKVLKKVIARRRRDSNEVAEEDAIFDLYLQAVGETKDALPSGTAPATRTVGHAKAAGKPAAEPRAAVLPGNEELAYADVKAFVIAERNPSTSFVQRRFQIGFNRASAFMERMEREGIVSAFVGGKREMLVAPVVTPEMAKAAAKLAEAGVSIEVPAGAGPIVERVAEAARQAGIPVTTKPIVGSFSPEDEADEIFGA